jgi:hypothetical protein
MVEQGEEDWKARQITSEAGVEQGGSMAKESMAGGGGGGGAGVEDDEDVARGTASGMAKE